MMINSWRNLSTLNKLNPKKSLRSTYSPINYKYKSNVSSISSPTSIFKAEKSSSFNSLKRFHSSSSHSNTSLQNNDHLHNSSLDFRREPLPAVYQELAKEINHQTRFAKYKYWIGYGTIIAASTLGAEYLIQSLAGVSDLGWTFLAVTGGSSLMTYLSLRFTGGQKVAESMGGKPIVRGQSAKTDFILDTVQDLASIAKLDAIPKCYYIPTQEMNAFAAGLTHATSVVAVTDGILNRLDHEEMRAVLAHEIGHLVGQDTRTATHIIAINAGFFALLRMGLNMMQFRGNEKESKNKQIAMALVGIGAASSIIGAAYRLAISRSREYSADACSVAFTGETRALASALQKIAKQSVDPDKSPLHAAGNHAMYSHMYLNNPISKQSGLFKTFQKLISTHPPVEDRIERLSSMERAKLQSKLIQKKMGN
eukprot:TRINITY_DN3881_c0_g1_i2.p1 TRINITY_DN3881_c0_g1~~TRINITY_DN3881_c0_g1_i2.p1  ORF type:complete len:424 (+),score=124.05 TRINITY_DN3881_c0_g1_i2:203-1474(+)